MMRGLPEIIKNLATAIKNKCFAPKIVQKKISMAADFNAASAPYREKIGRRQHSNCYTYALGIPEHGKATPGQLVDEGEKFSRNNINVRYIYNALIHDGLLPMASAERSPYKDAPIIAAFVAHEKDYHFYRLHKDGTWSHQLGWRGMLSPCDENGGFITDPLYADRGRYKDFVGFFALPQEGLRYRVPR